MFCRPYITIHRIHNHLFMRKCMYWILFSPVKPDHGLNVKHINICVLWSSPGWRQEDDISAEEGCDLKKVGENEVYTVFDTVHARVVACTLDLNWIDVYRDNCHKKRITWGTGKGWKNRYKSFSISPLWQVNANCIALPPTPQNASTMTSQAQRSAMCLAMRSGVTENQPSARNWKVEPLMMHACNFVAKKYWVTFQIFS